MIRLLKLYWKSEKLAQAASETRHPVAPYAHNLAQHNYELLMEEIENRRHFRF